MACCIALGRALDLSRSCHSGSPARRKPSANVARSSGRWIGSQSVRLEMRSSGSSSHKRCIARHASSARPASAWLAAMMPTTIRKLGKSLNDFSAHDDAVANRPANKCAIAIPACIRYISGSNGLNRIARVKCSIAPSGSPRQVLRKPPRNHAAARLGSTRCRHRGRRRDGRAHGRFV